MARKADAKDVPEAAPEGAPEPFSSSASSIHAPLPNTIKHQEDQEWSEHISQACYVLLIIMGAVFPCFKVCLIAMAEKLIRAALQNGLPDEVYGQIQTQVFDNSSNPIMDTFLMRSISFYGAFGITAAITAIMSISMPLAKGLSENFLNYVEVKRLQDLLFQKFVLEPNSVPIDEASDLLYTKINAIEKYWSRSKYRKVEDMISILTCTILFFILAWDLGLALLGGMILVFVIAQLVWNKLSTPWDQQREQKMAQANSLLVDVVLCKELVLTQAHELEEHAKLRRLLDADRDDIQHLVWAKFISCAVRVATFTMITPTLFFFVYTFDLTFERVFQLLIIIVLSDELMRAFLAYMEHAPIVAEFARAKQEFCHVLGMEEDELFPSEFEDWKFCCRMNNNQKKHLNERSNTGTEEEDLELGSGITKVSRSDSRAIQKQQSNRREQLRQWMQDLSSELSSRMLNPDKGVDQLSLENASFGYKNKNGETYAIVQNLTTTLNIGEHYAITGETGVGKSTFLKALSGLHQPLSGEIYFDGKAVDTTSIEWRRQVAVVTQHAVFLNRSLRENMTYGLPNPVDDTAIYKALEKVKMKDRVMALPNGLDTIITDNGNEFSGGQRQRLQIGRLLLSTAPLVLLDECTSALDPETTKMMLDVLGDFLADKTMIMVTHDIGTLVLAKHVMEMKPGGVFEKAKDHRVATIFGELDGRRPSEILQEFQKGDWLSSGSMHSIDTHKTRDSQEKDDVDINGDNQQVERRSWSSSVHRNNSTDHISDIEEEKEGELSESTTEGLVGVEDPSEDML